MNIDFHVHGKISKKNEFNQELFEQGMVYAKESGLDAVCLTEHFNAPGYERMIEMIEKKYHYNGHYYCVEGMRVYPGLEVDVLGGGHILVIASKEVIRSIYDELKDYKVKPNFIPFEKLLDLCENHRALVIGAHPFRAEHNLIEKQPLDLVLRLNALDLNATDIQSKGYETTFDGLKTFTAQHPIPIITGSDSHYPLQLGSVYTTITGEPLSVDDIKEAIDTHNFKRYVSKSLMLRVDAARHIKALIKNGHLKSTI